MDSTTIIAVASIVTAGITTGFGTMAPALGEGRAVATALTSLAQQPDASATITRTLPIKPVLENYPAEGHELLSVNTRPSQVTVKGPSAELAELQFIPTLPIDLSFLKGHTVIATDLDFKNLHLALKDAVPILADLQIAPKALTRIFSGVPVLTSQGAKVAPTQVTLTIKGPWPLVQHLKPEDLKAQVDTRNLSPGRHSLTISVDLPDGIRVERSRPATVTVTVPKSP